MPRTATPDSDSDLIDKPPSKKLDPIVLGVRNRDKIDQLTKRLDQMDRRWELIVTVLATKGVIIIGDQPARDDERPAERQRVGARTARCPADIILTIANAGRPLTLDDLAAALEGRYGRSTISGYATKMKAAGELVNDGGGYALPPAE